MFATAHWLHAIRDLTCVASLQHVHSACNMSCPPPTPPPPPPPPHNSTPSHGSTPSANVQHTSCSPPLPVSQASTCEYFCHAPHHPAPGGPLSLHLQGFHNTGSCCLQVVTAASLINTTSSSSQKSSSSGLEAAVAAATLPLAAPLNYTNLQVSALHAVLVYSF